MQHISVIRAQEPRRNRFEFMTAKQSLRHRPAILLVEDNDNDVELTKLAVSASGIAADLHCVNDGEHCMNVLRSTESPLGRLPDLIFLDLHMPRMSGLEVLQALAQDERLRHVPVVVLTTSDAPNDVHAAYRLGCRSYVVKPVGFEAFATLVKQLLGYWFSAVVLPQPTRGAAPPR